MANPALHLSLEGTPTVGFDYLACGEDDEGRLTRISQIVGDEQAGSDDEAGAPSPEAWGDAPLNGTVTVSVDVEDEAKIAKVREAFAEFEAADVDEA